MRNVTDKIIEKIKTRILCPITTFENRADYERMWKNMIEPGRPQMTTWGISIAWWVLKAKKTHTQNTSYIFAFPQQHWSHERSLMLRYTHIACPITPKFWS
jgi:hypothetical protein